MMTPQIYINYDDYTPVMWLGSNIIHEVAHNHSLQGVLYMSI